MSHRAIDYSRGDSYEHQWGSERDIENGKVTPHKEVMRKYKKWL